MSGLENLVRVHQWVRDEKRQRLSGLEQLLGRMEDDLEILEEKLAAEREAAGRSLDGALAFQTIIPAALERRDKLRHSIANLERDIRDAGFVQVRIDPKDESRDFIRDWAPGRNAEDYVVAATDVKPESIRPSEQPA